MRRASCDFSSFFIFRHRRAPHLVAAATANRRRAPRNEEWWNNPLPPRPAVFTLALLFNPLCCSGRTRLRTSSLRVQSIDPISLSFRANKRERSEPSWPLDVLRHTHAYKLRPVRRTRRFLRSARPLVSAFQEINSFVSVNRGASLSLPRIRWNNLAEILLLFSDHK